MPPSNLEFTKMNVDNLSENVVPQSASAKFNVRFNSKHKSSSLKKKLNKIINTVAKKEKCKAKIEYRVSGEAFYTQPNKEIHMVCLLYTSPSPRDRQKSRMPSSA